MPFRRRRTLRLESLEHRLNQATLTVTSLTDVVNPADNNTVFTLREAVNAANSAAGADTIQFAGGLNGSITLSGTELALTDTTGATTIAGPGANLLAVSGNNASRVFRVAVGVSADISGLTIRNGASSQGGGVLNLGTLDLSSSEVINNVSTGDGGGLWNSGTLTVTDCTFNDNAAVFSAGAIGVYNGGTANIANATLSGNSARFFGGGMDVNNGTVNVYDSTIVLNRAQNTGGGTGNGGGISNFGSVTLKNTIVAGNTRLTSAVSDDLANTALTAASTYNLIGDASSRGGLTNGVNGNKIGFALGAVLNTTLANNGGSTRTHALAAGGPALDAGLNANVPIGLSTDQRGLGYTRIVGTVDLGAVETQPAGLAPDVYESNDTADQATNLGFAADLGLPNLTLVDDNFGLPDYDWFRVTAATSDTFTFRIDSISGPVELAVFTLSGNTLVQLADSATSTNVQSVTISVTAGASYLIEAKPYFVGPGIYTQTGYSLSISRGLGNHAPTNVALDSLRVREDSPGAVLGVVTVADPDPSDTFTFVVSDSRFWVSEGKLRLKPTESLHFATEPFVDLTITATDNGGLSSPAIPFAIDVRQGSESAPYHNSETRSNVDRTDGVDPADILWTMYYYSLHPNGVLPAAPDDDSYPLVDITGDGTIDPQDILYAIFDYIASLGGEGEAPPADETPPAAAADQHDAALVWLMFAEELVAKRKTQGTPGFGA